MNIAFMDFETRSCVSLGKNSKAYINDPSTQIMSLVVRVGKDVWVWSPFCRVDVDSKWPEELTDSYNITVFYQKDLPEPIKQFCKLPDATFVAHNAEGFDKGIWNRFFPDLPMKWIDTIIGARICDLPGKLATLATLVGGVKQDNTAMMHLTKGRYIRGSAYYPSGNKPMWRKLLVYNVYDVIHLETIMEMLDDLSCSSFRQQWPDIFKHFEINTRGLRIDKQWVERCLQLWRELAAKAGEELNELTKGEINGRNVKSEKQFKQWLYSKGVVLPNDSLAVQTVNQVIENPEKFLDGSASETETIVAALALRQDAVKATTGKLTRALLDMGPNGKIVDCFKYNGAHTGRYSGSGFNPTNLPRGSFYEEEPYPDIYSDSYQPTKEELISLTRGCIIPDDGYVLIDADFSSIEARMVGWLADEQEMIETFAANGDLYKVMASKIYGVPVEEVTKSQRFAGKQAVLACGYQVGPDKFNAMCLIYGVELETRGTSATACVQTYRKAYPKVVRLWRELNQAAIRVARGHAKSVEAANCLMFMHKNALMVQLPSGRHLRYNGAYVEEMPAKFEPHPVLPHFFYYSPTGKKKSMYGGAWLENISQAASKDILQTSLTNELAEAPCILHVYDQFVWQVKEQDADRVLRELMKHVTAPIDWAPGFPNGAEGSIKRRYSKGDQGAKPVKALSGVLL